MNLYVDAARARVKSQTPEERKRVATKAARARWLRASHDGEIDLVSMKVPCFILGDRRMLSQKGLTAVLNMKSGGQGNTKMGNDRLVRFVHGRTLGAFLQPATIKAIEEPVAFLTPKGHAALGFDANVLIEICEAVVTAAVQGKLQRQQGHIAQRCALLQAAFSRLGLIALIDEATGYQYERERDALALILERWIGKELAAWTKTFPPEFYTGLRRLRGEDEPTDKNQHPLYYGTLTNNIVYDRLESGVLAALREKNPITENGRRRHKHHQWLTPELGHPKLKEHLVRVDVLMKMSKTYDEFIANMNAQLPRRGDTLPMDFLQSLKPTPRPTSDEVEQPVAPSSSSTAATQTEMFKG